MLDTVIKMASELNNGGQGRHVKEVRLVLTSEISAKGRPIVDKWWSKSYIRNK